VWQLAVAQLIQRFDIEQPLVCQQVNYGTSLDSDNLTLTQAYHTKYIAQYMW